MAQKYPIDSDWFYQALRNKRKSMSALARSLNIDKSAASRMLRGERKMSAEEQDQIAQFLGVALQEVAAHRAASLQGFAEMKQSDFAHAEISSSNAGTNDAPGNKSKHHPIFGCMKGTMTIPDDLDLTAPIDVEWSNKLYNE